MPSETEVYSSWVGLAYVFNLIVGTGALTLPEGFASAGWFLSTVLLVLLCFISFVCVTFVIESIACANATIRWRHIQSHKIDESENEISESDEDHINEETAIVSNGRTRRKNYNLDTKVELCEMSDVFMNKTSRILFYTILSIYLLGDLSIYTAALSKTLVDLSCDTSNDTYFNTERCWSNFDFHKIDVYRMYVLFIALLIGPFTYFNIQKTKYLQMCTLMMRWTAFVIMISLAVFRISEYGPQGHPRASNMKEIPTLIGSSVYSFMCHHSIPNLIAPFSNKQHISLKLGVDMTIICVFYILLSITGVFAFQNVQDLYTLNFIPEHANNSTFFMNIVYYFLGAFPLFTLSTSFPIIAITLQNNLKSLVLDRNTTYGFFVRRLLFPTVVILPPVFIALTTHNLKKLVEVTGSYPGVFVQYVFPVFLAYSARKFCRRTFGNVENRFSSPFRGNFWFVLVLAWAVVCMGFETYNFIVKYS
ncbi:transmembrane protein 104 homolog [Harmonia axyridis]|uniref:transmembrane protein 104 homolog n=1 Tax=Harmonia axyridis TaxID=115357 RepID=UPI001E278433|nr:transmembrane protein 104 homolog [Harmonia axyridis]